MMFVFVVYQARPTWRALAECYDQTRADAIIARLRRNWPEDRFVLKRETRP